MAAEFNESFEDINGDFPGDLHNDDIDNLSHLGDSDPEIIESDPELVGSDPDLVESEPDLVGSDLELTGSEPEVVGSDQDSARSVDDSPAAKDLEVGVAEDDPPEIKQKKLMSLVLSSSMWRLKLRCRAERLFFEDLKTVQAQVRQFEEEFLEHIRTAKLKRYATPKTLASLSKDKIMGFILKIMMGQLAAQTTRLRERRVQMVEMQAKYYKLQKEITKDYEEKYPEEPLNLEREIWLLDKLIDNRKDYMILQELFQSMFHFHNSQQRRPMWCLMDDDEEEDEEDDSGKEEFLKSQMIATLLRPSYVITSLSKADIEWLKDAHGHLIYAALSDFR